MIPLTATEIQNHVWRNMSEKDLYLQIRRLAERFGWRYWHQNQTRREVEPGLWIGDRDNAGWPDLTLAHPDAGLLLRELKTQAGKLTPIQLRAVKDLREAGADVFVWRPSSLPKIERILQYPAHYLRGEDTLAHPLREPV